jgi:hypothetical protein
MDRKLKYGLVASLLLWPLIALALAACFNRLPIANMANPYAEPHDTGHNWVGQGAGAVLGNALFLLVLIYTVKFFISRLPVRWVRLYCFALLVLSSLPCIWLLLVLDWRNRHIYRFTCWVYDPLGFWFIPAVTFIADVVAMRTPSIRWYAARSCVEILLMVPWIIVWAFVSVFILGGGWI